MVTAEGREIMLEIAKMHDRIAELAERMHEGELAPQPTGGDGKG
jgi:hypothetical protein